MKLALLGGGSIAAALSLSGIGPGESKVRIVSDPEAKLTRHEIVASGVAGRVRIEIESRPNPNNPGSSFLAALSAIAAVRSLAV